MGLYGKFAYSLDYQIGGHNGVCWPLVVADLIDGEDIFFKYTSARSDSYGEVLFEGYMTQVSIHSFFS